MVRLGTPRHPSRTLDRHCVYAQQNFPIGWRILQYYDMAITLRNSHVGVDNNNRNLTSMKQIIMLWWYNPTDKQYNNMKCKQTHRVVAIHNNICNEVGSYRDKLRITSDSGIGRTSCFLTVSNLACIISGVLTDEERMHNNNRYEALQDLWGNDKSFETIEYSQDAVAKLADYNPPADYNLPSQQIIIHQSAVNLVEEDLDSEDISLSPLAQRSWSESDTDDSSSYCE